MGDKEKSLHETVLEKVLDEIKDPWDWIAAGVGAAIGGGFALIIHLPDLSATMATGCVTGVTIRKAWMAARQRSYLRRRAKGLDKLFQKIQDQFNPISHTPPDDLTPQKLTHKLRLELDLWEMKVISNEQFSQQLDDLVRQSRLMATSLTSPKPVKLAKRLPKRIPDNVTPISQRKYDPRYENPET